MIPRELLKKVRQIEILTLRTVNDVLAGRYHSAFRGQGIEFEEVSPYQIGDDVRLIDWNVSARQGEPFIKKYREERELTVMLVVDASGSGFFGSGEQFKVDLATEVCAVVAFSAIRTNDKVGLILFTDEVEKYVPAKKGRRHGLRMIRELLYHEPRGRGTDIAAALNFLNRVTVRKSICFLISDFLAEGYEPALRIARRRHDLIPVVLSDPREEELPPLGLLELEDPETGELLVVDTAARALRERFTQETLRRRVQRDQLFRRMDTPTVPIRTDGSYVDELVRFFHQRRMRR